MSPTFAQNRSSVLRAVVAGACSLLASTAHANQRFWNGGGANNNWSTTGNWAPFFGVPANDGTDDIIMQSTTRLTPLVDIDYDILSLQFNATAGAFTVSNAAGADLSIRGGGITNNDADLQVISRVVLGANQTWNAAAGRLQMNSVALGGLTTPRMLTVSGAFDTAIMGTIAGSGLTNGGSMVLSSTANLTLGGSASNTFTGPVTVNAGTLLLNKTSGVAVPGDLIIGNGAGNDVVKLLNHGQLADACNVTINSSGILDTNAFDDTFANLTMTGGTLTGGSFVRVDGAITTNASATSALFSSRRLSYGGVGSLTITVSDGAAVDDLILHSDAFNFTKTGPGQMSYEATPFAFGDRARPVVNSGTLLLATQFMGLGDLRVGDGIGGAGADVARLEVNTMFGLEAELVVKESGLCDFNGHDQQLTGADITGGMVTLGGAVVSMEVLQTRSSSITARVSEGTLRVIPETHPEAAFVSVADGPAAIDLEISSSLASMNGLTIGGGGAIVLSGPQRHAGALKINPCTVTFSTDIGGEGFPSGIVSDGATVNFATTQHVGAVVLLGGRASIASGGTRVLVTPDLSVDTSDAVFDLAEHAVIINYTVASPLTSIESAIVSAYHNGAWDGFGITSSLADATHGIGCAEASALGLTTFAGESVDATSVLVKFTYFGDANLDGKVDVTDLGVLATNWQTSASWSGGDFNYDGFVDVTDLGALATNWQQGVGSPLAAPRIEEAMAAVGLSSASVPEPAAALASIAMLLATTVRAHRRIRS